MTQYCTNCGAELRDGAHFCSECGAATEEEPEDAPESAEEDAKREASEEAESWRQYLPDTWRIGVAGAVLGLVIGLLVAWGLATIGGSGFGFLLGFLLATLFLWQKDTAVGAVGSGLYIAALTLVLVPLFFYGPMVGSSEDPQTAEEAGAAVGSVLGLFIWTVVFAIVGAVIGATGYFLKRRERKKLSD